MHRKFRYIAKFRYHSEISLCSEISTYSENFAMIAKLPLSSCLLLGSFSLHYAFSSLLFLHPRLDEIANKPYELGIYRLNFDAKLEMMVKVYKTCKTTKNNLEIKSVVLKDLHMSIGLNNMISTQKALKAYLK